MKLCVSNAYSKTSVYSIQKLRCIEKLNKLSKDSRLEQPNNSPTTVSSQVVALEIKFESKWNFLVTLNSVSPQTLEERNEKWKLSYSLFQH